MSIRRPFQFFLVILFPPLYQNFRILTRSKRYVHNFAALNTGCIGQTQFFFRTLPLIFIILSVISTFCNFPKSAIFLIIFLTFLMQFKRYGKVKKQNSTTYYVKCKLDQYQYNLVPRVSLSPPVSERRDNPFRSPLGSVETNFILRRPSLKVFVCYLSDSERHVTSLCQGLSSLALGGPGERDPGNEVGTNIPQCGSSQLLGQQEVYYMVLGPGCLFSVKTHFRSLEFLVLPP